MSENSGRSIEPNIALPYYDNHFIVWSDFSFGESEVLFKGSLDGGNSFGKTINLSNSSGPSHNPQIAAWNDHIYVVWDDKTSGNDEVMFAASSDFGTKFSPAINLSNSSANSVDAKVAIPESHRNAYVVWIEQNTSTGFDDVLVRVSKDSGLTFGDVINLSNNRNGSSSNAQLAVSYTSEHLYVTWQTIFDDGNTEVFFRHSGDGGITFDKTVNLSNSEDQSDDQKIAVSLEYVFVVWHEHSSTISDIFFTRISMEGTYLDRPANLSNNTVQSGSGAASPQIAAALERRVFVMWHETTSSGDDRIVLRLSVDAGDPFVDKVIIDDSAGALDSSDLAAGDSLSIVWRRGNDIFFRQQSLDDWSVFTQKINLSNNSGDSYSPQIAASGPKVAAVWIDGSFGSNGDIAYMDITPLVYFEYPLHSYFRATTDDHRPTTNIVAGDNVTITAIVDNHSHRTSADAMFGLQVLNEEGIAEFISVVDVSIVPEERNALVTFTWTPKASGWIIIEGFVWSDDGYVLSPKVADQRIAVGSRHDYNISLQHEIEKTRVAAGEPVNGSLYLVNNGDQTQFVTVDEIFDRNSPLNYCYYFQHPELYNPIALPPGAKVNLNHTITWMQWHPATYNSTWFALLSIKSDNSSSAECLQVASNTVLLDVLPRPSPEGVTLAMSTDKLIYRRNETIQFDAYIDNNSGRPFDLSNFEFGVYFADKTGKELAGLTWVLADVNDVIKPYTVKAVPLYHPMWDQTYPELDGRWVQLPLGEYTIHAEQWPPFLKSDPVAIAIIE